MKVIAINGSPRKGSNTLYALNQIGEELQSAGIEFELLHIGNKIIRGCLSCGQCESNQNEKCVIDNDMVNESLGKMKEADGILISSPVYYSGIAGTVKCFLDRVFRVAAANNNLFLHKTGASVIAVRRTGGTMTINHLNRYLASQQMDIPTSDRYNIIYGLKPGDAAQDEQGIQTMKMLARNMARVMKQKNRSGK